MTTATKSNRRVKRKAGDALPQAGSKRAANDKSAPSLPRASAIPSKTVPRRDTVRKGVPKRDKLARTDKSSALNEEEKAVYDKLKRKMELKTVAANNLKSSRVAKRSPRGTRRTIASRARAEQEDEELKKNDDDHAEEDEGGELQMEEEDRDDSDEELAECGDEDDNRRGNSGVDCGERVESDEEEEVCLDDLQDEPPGDDQFQPAPVATQMVQSPVHEEIASTIPDSRSTYVDSVVKNLMKEVKEFVYNHTQAHTDRMVAEIKKERETIGKMEAHVQELSTIISTSAAAMFIKQPNAPPRLKEIHRKLCLLPALFNEKFMLRVLSRTVMGSFLNMVKSGYSYKMLESQGLDMLSILYFAKQNDEKSKDKYSSSVGKLFSKFRQSFISTAFLAMQNNSLQTFSDTSFMADITTVGPGSFSPDITRAERNDPAEDTSPGMGNIITQPFWLKPGYVRIDHCHSALLKSERRAATDSAADSSQAETENVGMDNDDSELAESSQSSKRSKVSPRSGPITNEEIASEAAYLVSKTITGLMNKSRQASKLELFNNVLYLFTGWAQHDDISIDQRNMQLSWLKLPSHDVDYMDKIEATRTFRLADMGKAPNSSRQQLDLDNLKRLESLIGEHPEFTIVAEHDVLVEGRPRRLYCRINLIESITKLISSYCSLESNSKSKDTLGIHRHCLKALVVMAMGLRFLMQKAIHDSNVSKTVPWAGNSSTKGKKGRPKKRSMTDSSATPAEFPRYKFETLGDLSLERLQPSLSKQKVSLIHMILNLTEEEYAVKNYSSVTPRTPVTHSDPSHNEEEENEHIEVDENNGVFAI